MEEFVKKLRSEAGVTLVELLVAGAAFTLVSLAAFAVLQSGQRSAVMNDQTVQVQQNVRLGMDLVARDLRMAGFGNPIAGGLPAGCAGIINPTENQAGADNGPDSVQFVTAGQAVGTLAVDYIAGTNIQVNNMDPNIANGQILSIEGVFTAAVIGVVPAVPPAAGSVTLSRAIAAPIALQAGSTVVRLDCIRYSVSGGGVTPPYQLLRQVGPGPSVAIVDGIESLQLAYALDANNDGTIDDLSGANGVDCKDFIPNDTATNGQCPGGVPATPVSGIPASVTAIPTSVRQVRITVVGRAIPPAAANVALNCWRDPTYTGTGAIQVEDQFMAEPAVPVACGLPAGGIRRRALTRVITLRNGSNL
jgi:type IV pilus assembly protein PilW